MPGLKIILLDVCSTTRLDELDAFDLVRWSLDLEPICSLVPKATATAPAEAIEGVLLDFDF